jgi:hypothetical protein
MHPAPPPSSPCEYEKLTETSAFTATGRLVTFFSSSQ